MASKNHSEFSSGRTVKARDLQYIQRPADSELLDHCRNGRPAYILHSPQMGKSSLIAHTAEQLNANAHHAVLIDLSQFPLPPREDEWFHKIVRILDDSLDLSTDPITWWENQPGVPPPARLTQLLTEVILPELTSPLVLFIDEIERTAALPFREHFFGWLARLYESRETDSILYRLSFVVCGVATPSQLIPEDSPLLFQWSHRVVLSDFTLPEALLLAEGLSLPTAAATEAVQWIYRWTNGHPYLTQLLCQLLEGQHRMAWSDTEVDECIQHFISSPQGLREPNFQFVRTALTEPTPDGSSLLEPYLALLEGKTGNLENNQSALEQLRLVGVLREDDENMIIRNLLYQEVFPATWVKRHLGSPLALAPPPEPPFTPAPDPSPQPVAVPQPPPAPQQSYVMAASLFVVGVGLLIWFFRGPVMPPLAGPTQEVSSTSIDTSPPSSGNAKMPDLTQQPEALIQAQEKIQALETTIATYQRLANEELENRQTQRTQLETQLHAQESNLSDLRATVIYLKEDLQNQKQTEQQTQLDFESARENLEKALASATSQRNTARQESKTLQTALLKQSSLSPGEIKELVADRNQIEAKLTTVNDQLSKAQQEARDLATLLSKEELSAKSEEAQFERDRAQLQTQLNTLRVELKHTKESLQQTEQHAQGQHILAQQELSRLQQARISAQDELTEKQQILSKHQQRLSTLETESSQYRQELEETLAANTTFQAQLQGSQQIETQLQSRVAQLETDVMQTQEEADAKQSALLQEREHLSHSLAQALTNFETTNNRLTTLSTQLTSTKQELANRHVAIRDINAASSEKTQLEQKQLTALVRTKTDLESRLRQNEGALSHAQQRITELEGHTEKATNLSQALETSKKENQTLRLQLASTQQQFDNLQASLKSAPATVTGHSGNPSASTSRTAQMNRILPLITTAITAPPAITSLSKTSKLLWARQAFLFSQRSGGRARASIDHSLRNGLHASPIQLKGVSGRVHALTYDPSGDHVIAGTSKGKILLWSLSQPTDSPLTLTGHTAGVVSVTVSPDGQRLASGSLDSTIRIWSLSQPSAHPRLLQAHTKGVTSLAFRPDGKRLVSGSQDHTIRVWDVTKDQPQSAVLGKHDGRVNAIAYTPDGQSLLSGGDDLTLRVWDLQRTDSPPQILRGHQQSISAIAIHPSGWMVATGSRDRQIGLWNLRQSLTSPTFLTGSTGRISQVQFNADGTSVASVGSDKSLRIWNWHEAKQPPVQFPKHKGTLEAMAISPDGRTIAVGGSSQRVTLWSGTEQLAHAVCDTAKENLSFSEWKKIVGEGIPYERTCPNLPLHPSFLEEGKRLAKQGSRNQAKIIFERAKQLDPYLEFDPKKEIEKLLSKSS